MDGGDIESILRIGEGCSDVGYFRDGRSLWIVPGSEQECILTANRRINLFSRCLSVIRIPGTSARNSFFAFISFPDKIALLFNKVCYLRVRGRLGTLVERGNSSDIME